MSKRSTLCIVLCLILIIGLFAGCTGGKTGGSETPANSAASGSSSGTSSGGNEPAPSGEFDQYAAYPICAPGEIEFEFYYPLFTIILAHMEDLNGNPIMQEMEKLSGVHINWIHPNQTTEAETYSLMFVSNDLPDIVKELMSTYPGGFDAAIADGYYIDINPYSDFYPNYYNTLKSNNQFMINATTDEGHIRGFGYMYNASSRVIYGIGYRKDIFNNLGISKMPELISDWDAAFAKLKSAGYSNFLELGSYGVDANWTPAYDCYNTLIAKDNKAVYGPAMDGYKDYLTQMHEWYQKGYMNRDITHNSGASADNYSVWYNDETLIGSMADNGWGSTFYDNHNVESPDFYIAAAFYPRQTANQVTHNWSRTSYFMHTTYITTACQNIEAACKWLDYWYTDNGTMFCRYGVEGISYYYDENGHPWLNDYIVNNPDGIGIIWMLFMNSFMGGIGVEDTAPRFELMPTVEYETLELSKGPYGTGADDWNMAKSIFQTADEGSEYSKIMSDIETYVSEFTSGVILGNIDINTEWDRYVSQLKTMKLDRAMEIYQLALDRYYARASK